MNCQKLFEYVGYCALAKGEMAMGSVSQSNAICATSLRAKVIGVLPRMEKAGTHKRVAASTERRVVIPSRCLIIGIIFADSVRQTEAPGKDDRARIAEIACQACSPQNKRADYQGLCPR